MILSSSVISQLTFSQSWSLQSNTSNIYYNTGNVGIGTNAPAYPLSVSASQMHIFSVNPHAYGVDLHSTGNFSPYYQTNFTVYKGNIGSGTAMFDINALGNIGIGTTAQTDKLAIQGRTKILGGNDLVLQASSASPNDPGDIVFQNNSGTELSRIYSDPNGAGDIKFSIGSIPNTEMILTAGGNLGIGDVAPTEKLEVGGNVQVSGNNPYVKIRDRFILQGTATAANDWTRALIGHNIMWNETTGQWEVDNGPYNDFSMIRFENGGNIGFYVNPGTGASGSYSMADADLLPSRRMLIDWNGQVGIGTTNIHDRTFKLYVETGIRTRKIKVDQSTWSDYVFDKGFVLSPLSEVERFIKKYRHLPDVPSATEVAKEGVDLGENQAVLLKKIEELTLYIIEQQKQIDELKRLQLQADGRKKTVRRIVK